MGGRGASSRSSSYTRSRFSSSGLVALVTNNSIGNASSYQGRNGGSGRAHSEGALGSGDTRSRIEQYAEANPKYLDKDAYDAARNVSSPGDIVTVYRATTGGSINHGDWVFLTEGQADQWARTLFSKKPKSGYKVIKANVPASQVHWTGKNMEFMVE